MWQQFDDRLLHHRVLPPVVAEMRNAVVALAALPLVLAIMGQMKPDDFAARWAWGQGLCLLGQVAHEHSSPIIMCVAAGQLP